MSGKCPHCRRPVIWVLSSRGKNLPLDPRTDPRGQLIPLKGRAWDRRELATMPEPWCDFAAADGHLPHPATCPLWPRKDPEKRRGGAQGHLACWACGVIDATVRHTEEGDRCGGCRVSVRLETRRV